MPDAPTPESQTPAMATEAQLQALHKLQVAHDLPLSKVEASRLIEEATQQLDLRRLQHERDRMQAQVGIKRAVVENVKLNREIKESHIESEVAEELAKLRQTGREQDGRKSGRGR